MDLVSRRRIGTYILTGQLGTTKRGSMNNVRKEVMDVIRYCDILLYTGVQRGPMTDLERGLLEGYVMRLSEELKLSPDVSAPWDASQPERRRGGTCQARSLTELSQQEAV